MSSSDQPISTLLLPMNGFYSVLPQATIVEVTQRPDVELVTDSADWLMGIFDWRSERVPLLSFETLCRRQAAERQAKSHIVVLYALEGIPDLVFYALDLSAIPHPVTLQPNMISDSNEEPISSKFIARNIQIVGQPGVIPDLKRIEYKIKEELVHTL